MKKDRQLVFYFMRKMISAPQWAAFTRFCGCREPIAPEGVQLRFSFWRKTGSGRRKLIAPDVQARMVDLYYLNRATTIAQIARHFNVSDATAAACIFGLRGYPKIDHERKIHDRITP